ncbi:MAG: hypothetical protein DMG15_09485 [Acidobacteria bacterium]|nr:MAG: hypothetical protein DMG16_08955 [Acidobacteriota bacterium]PYS13922.1 MAG: hypothetical protein DMG15_09485 [Acidobacteriota bacterium]
MTLSLWERATLSLWERARSASPIGRSLKKTVHNLAVSSSEQGGGKGEGFTLNIPLPADTSAREHRQAFADAIRDIEGRFPPALTIISAGFDSRRGDPLGGLMLDKGHSSPRREARRRPRDWGLI